MILYLSGKGLRSLLDLPDGGLHFRRESVMLLFLYLDPGAKEKRVVSG